MLSWWRKRVRNISFAYIHIIVFMLDITFSLFIQVLMLSTYQLKVIGCNVIPLYHENTFSVTEYNKYLDSNFTCRCLNWFVKVVWTTYTGLPISKTILGYIWWNVIFVYKTLHHTNHWPSNHHNKKTVFDQSLFAFLPIFTVFDYMISKDNRNCLEYTNKIGTCIFPTKRQLWIDLDGS